MMRQQVDRGTGAAAGGLTEVIVEESRAGADRQQQILQFMTTEHFTLQTARGVANAEITSRLQLYLGTLSSAIIALALTAQLSGLGFAFRGFALVLLPVVFFLGVVTHGRLLQVNAEWRLYGQGMNRIRHYFLELAPEMERYFVLPATDDPWVTLAAIGVQTGGNPWWQALLTAGSMIVVVNSVLAGVVAGLVWRSVAGPSGPLPLALAAAVGFLLAWSARASMGSGRSAASWRPPRWPSLPDPPAKTPLMAGLGGDQQTDPEGQQPP
jgi:hypothetical protein